MSCNTVPESVIHAIVAMSLEFDNPGNHPAYWAALGEPHGQADCDALRRKADHRGGLLVCENARAVCARYPHNAPAPLAFGELPPAEYSYRATDWPRVEPRDVISPELIARGMVIVDQYVYQADQSPTWETSEARKICDRVRDSLCRALFQAFGFGYSGETRKPFAISGVRMTDADPRYVEDGHRIRDTVDATTPDVVCLDDALRARILADLNAPETPVTLACEGHATIRRPGY